THSSFCFIRVYRLLSALIRVKKKLQVARIQQAPPAGGEVGEGEAADAGAVEGFDVVADGGEHAADLVVAAFGERQPRVARAQDLESGRRQRRVLGFEHQRSAGEDGRLVAAQVAGQRRLVRLGQLRLRRD